MHTQAYWPESWPESREYHTIVLQSSILWCMMHEVFHSLSFISVISDISEGSCLLVSREEDAGYQDCFSSDGMHGRH